MRDDIGTSSGEGDKAGRFNPSVRINRSLAFQSGYHAPGEVGFFIAELDKERCGTGQDNCEEDRVENISKGESLWVGTDLFSWNHQPTFYSPGGTVNYSNSGDPSMNYGHWVASYEADPQMDGCYLDLDEQTAPIGILSPTAEIGANALYLYENGVRTDKPAFVEEQFVGCGAVIDGVNDGLDSCTTLSAQYDTFKIKSCGYYGN